MYSKCNDVNLTVLSFVAQEKRASKWLNRRIDHKMKIIFLCNLCHFSEFQKGEIYHFVLLVCFVLVNCLLFILKSKVMYDPWIQNSVQVHQNCYDLQGIYFPSSMADGYFG